MRTMAMWLGVLLMATGAMAEERTPTESAPRNIVALDLGGLLRETFGVSAERALRDRVSVRVGLRAGLSALLRFNPVDFGSSDTPVTSWNRGDLSLELEPGARFFLTGRAPEGFWVGPQLGLKLGWIHSRTELADPNYTTYGFNNRTLAVSGSALAGYSAVLSKGITLQAAAGLGLTHLRPLGLPYVVQEFGSGFTSQWSLQPLTQLSLGYAF
jgi:hypothetical protein